MKFRFLFPALVGLASLSAFGVTTLRQADAEAAITKGLGKLRTLSDADRKVATRDLASRIHGLAKGRKLELALGLANLSTEGDFGRDTLQAVTDTLADAYKETRPIVTPALGSAALDELAQLEAYEHMHVSVRGPLYGKAKDKLAAIDKARAQATFSLPDLNGKTWTLADLKGKVVLVNFWATWCPPCRKEMPDLEKLTKRFGKQGFVVLAISDEEHGKVAKFIGDHGYTFPILLDAGRKVNSLYQVQGIPKSFVYDRKGKLVTQSIDMRTEGQFLAMLARAGLKGGSN